MTTRDPAAPPPAATSLASASEPSFEEAVQRLSEIVATLERGELPLEDSLRLFEEGVRLSRLSQSRLDRAEKVIERLLAVDADGRPKTVPFETTPDDE
jgi:exodeoxyribonuclease VII small subunit